MFKSRKSAESSTFFVLEKGFSLNSDVNTNLFKIDYEYFETNTFKIKTYY